MAVVLLVGNDLPTRCLLCRALVHRSYTALAVATGKEALECSSCNPDVVLFSLHLPDIDGLSMFLSLHRACPQVIGIVLGLYETVTEVALAFKAGVADYVGPPFTSTQVIGLIEQLAERHNAPCDGRPGVVSPIMPSQRLARAIVAATDETPAVSSVAEWGRRVGVSRSALRAWSYREGIRPCNALSFVRALTAVRHAAVVGVDPHELLGFADSRSVQRFVAKTGPLAHGRQIISVETYCVRQPFIDNKTVVRDVMTMIFSRNKI
jgi:CheY-like chemotaxis protein